MNCPNCGATNRDGACFCGRCAGTLPAMPAAKGCPQCGVSNREGARFCGKCGYTFPPGAAVPAAPAPGAFSAPPGKVRLGSRRGLLVVAAVAAAFLLVVVVALLAAALNPARPGVAGAVVSPTRTARPATRPVRTFAATGTPAVTAERTPPASSQTDGGLRQALLGTVQIIAPTGSGASSTGSGTTLTPKGHILTNFHVIGNPDTGRLYNRSGDIFVALNPPDLRADPEVRYVAEVVEVDRGLDLALLKLRALVTGEALPADLELPVMPVGDSDTVNIGDQLSIIGFPGLGGNTVTYTRGTVSGFLTGEGWIKTDAEINSGNSGGAAIDASGKLVGIPSEANAERTEVPGKIGLVRPVNLARPLIDLALQDAR